MKTQNILLLVLLITGSNLLGQTISIYGGPLVSSMKGQYTPFPQTPSDKWYQRQFNDDNFKDNYWGWNAGVEIDYLQKEKIFLTSSCGILKNGSKGIYWGTWDGHMTQEEITTEFLSISFSTLFNVKLITGKKVVPYIGLGPQIDGIIENRLPSEFIFNYYDLERKLNKVLVGFQGGCGVNFSSNHIQAGVGIFYSNFFNRLLNYTTDSGYINSVDDHEINLRMNIAYFSSKVSIGYQF